MERAARMNSRSFNTRITTHDPRGLHPRVGPMTETIQDKYRPSGPNRALSSWQKQGHGQQEPASGIGADSTESVKRIQQKSSRLK
jgi:hypothetical protein